jgi:hypothetical protein
MAEDRYGPADEIVGGPSGPSGPSGPPGPPRRGRLVLIAVAALLFGYVTTHRYPSPEPRPIAAGTPDGWDEAAPGSGTRVGRGPPGLRLLVGGPAPKLVDTATGQSTRLDVPAAGPRAPARLVRVGDGLLAFVPSSSPGSSAPVRLAYLLRPGSAAVGLGAADAGIAARGGGVITVHRTPAGGVLAGFGADGTRRWQRRAPVGVEPLADTGYGLVLHLATDPAGPDQVAPLLLVDPASGAVRRQLARQASTVLASRDDAVAWLGPGSCPPDCAVRITELASGGTRNVQARADRAPIAGAFSPDGRLLALSFGGGGLPTGSTRYPDGLVSVVEVGSGSARVVRGYGGGLYPPSWVDWSADGRLVVMLAAAGGRERLRVAVSRAGGVDGFTLLPWAFLAMRSLAVAP